MYELIVKESFESAHHIKGHEGKCARPHGHSYHVEACFRAEKVDHLGISCDFSILRKLLCEIVDQLDHQDLNTLSFFDSVNPTAETIAKVIYDHLKPKCREVEVELLKIQLWETDHYCAIYYE